MTVSNTDSPVKIYTGTATEYPIPFDYISDNDILVTLYNTTTGAATDQTIDVDYTIVEETVTYSEEPGAEYNVVIRRVTECTQEASFGPGEEPPLSTHESAFDKLTMLAQDLDERLSRCVILPDSYSGEDFTLPDLVLNAGKLVRINTDGDGLEAIATVAAGQALDVTAYCDAADLTRLHAVMANPEIYPEWYGAKGDGTTDDTAAINSALATGGTVVLTSSSYKITDTLTCAVAGTKLISWNDSEIVQATSNKGGINVTVSDVGIHGVTWTGPQHATSQSSETGINVYGVDSAHYISDIKVIDCKVTGWGFYGIRLNFVENFEIHRNKVYAVYQAGIQTLSARKGRITINEVGDIDSPAGGGVYGIALSRITTDSISENPRSSDIIVQGNYVYDVVNWEGLDTHGGERIGFVGNIVYGCKIGINISSASDGAAATWGAIDCVASGNILDSGVTDGSSHTGIVVNGASGDYAKVSVCGNVLYNYGSDTDAGNEAGILVNNYTRGCTITGNVINTPSRYGIRLIDHNSGFSITGNTITDAWSDIGTSAGVCIDGGSNTGIIDGNSFVRTGANSAKASDYLSAIRIDDESGNAISVGSNHTEGVGYYIADPGDRSFRGINSSNIATAGTGEDDLRSQTIPGGFLGGGATIRVRASFINTGSGGNKTGKFYFGTSEFTVHPSDNNTNDWMCDISIVVTGPSSQKISLVAYSGATVVYQNYSPSSQDITNDVVLKFTGECADAGDAITQYIMDVRIN